ncbi:unnamed protein product [Owenia fusiformis]|uniref:Uncharacterized protein n=1 Tax=Owenia fusiformis TaxID=6347 RepID=A0A8J1Y586_OWEFU|nr:unnamed protein product [Owenia fusiformis]
MVMHARKYQRLNDGYYDRNDSHSYSGPDKYPPKNYWPERDRDRYKDHDRGSPYSRRRDRSDSPSSRPSPRYHNKSSYLDRNRDRYDRGSNHSSPVSPSDRKSNHSYHNDSDFNRSYNHDRAFTNTRESRDSGRDVRDRDRDSRDMRERDTRDIREGRNQIRESRESRAFGDSREIQESRDGRESVRESTRESVREMRETARERGSNRERQDSTASKDGTQREHKVDVQKSAQRLCGDWSEHISSSGKKYYYNVKSEVSQWEKPKEWNEALVTKPACVKEKERQQQDKQRQAYNEKSDKRKPHSSSQASERNDTSHQSSSGDRTKHYHKDRPGDVGRTNSNDHVQHRIGGSSGHSRQHHTPHQYDYSKVDTKTQHKHSSGNSNGYTSNNERYDRHTSDPPHQALFNSQNSQESRLHENEDNQHEEDMDISPGSTPTNSRPPSRQSHPSSTPHYPPNSTPGIIHGTPPTSTPSYNHSYPTVSTPTSMAIPQLITHLGEKTLQKVDNQQLTQQALQTLQKLHKALSTRVSKHQHNTGHSPRSTIDQSPQVQVSPHMEQMNHTPNLESERHHQEHHPLGHQSPPCSPNSHRSPRAVSPAPSDGSSQDLPANSSNISAPPVQQPSVHLTPSLSNYYKDSLLGHVRGWPGDHFDRQACRYADEAHTIGNLHCTKVSADLKKARSLVRVAEIQATLQEQRILFLRQQIKDLESLKNQTTYMPSRPVATETPPK